MGRQVVFRATCYNREEEVEAAGKAHSIFRGTVPGARRVCVLTVKPINGFYGPTNPMYQSATWWEDDVGWNPCRRR
jgi:hypothetical protein